MIFKPEPKIERIACRYNISFSRVITTIVEGFFERMEHESSEE